jgi:hypothetical protein
MDTTRSVLAGVQLHRDESEEGLVDWREILQQYKASSHDQPQAQQLRLAFLRLLVADITILETEEAVDFLAQEIQAEDLELIEWESAETILHFCDQLYTLSLPTSDLRDLIRAHVHTLLRQVLQKYESEEDHEHLFTSVQGTPTFALWNDEELKRLRHLAYRYEIKRVTRNRRLLYGYLFTQAILVLLVFPLLFINAENGALQATVEELTDVEIGDKGYQLLSYTDALYWSIITAASVGYGDITPTTTTGRIIAAILGTIGVITIGIIAGLVLDWITPRRLD